MKSRTASWAALLLLAVTHVALFATPETDRRIEAVAEDIHDVEAVRNNMTVKP